MFCSSTVEYSPELDNNSADLIRRWTFWPQNEKMLGFYFSIDWPRKCPFKQRNDGICRIIKFWLRRQLWSGRFLLRPPQEALLKFSTFLAQFPVEKTREEYRKPTYTVWLQYDLLLSWEILTSTKHHWMLLSRDAKQAELVMFSAVSHILTSEPLYSTGIALAANLNTYSLE